MLGVLVGGAIVLVDIWLFAPQISATGTDTADLSSSPWQGALATFYGAIAESCWCDLD